MKTLLEYTVRDLMHRDPVTIAATAPLREAIRVMAQHKVSAVFVEPEHATDAHGIVTRKDIVMEAIENYEGLAALKVADVATKPVITIPAHVGIKHAGRLMRLTGVRRLAVYEGDKLVGMLSNTDLFREIQKME